MSVASHAGSKRLLHGEGAALGEVSPLAGKRGRWTGEQVSSCAQASRALPPSLKRSTILALAALFPSMSDQEIAAVLEEYGNDVDAAIKRLNELQLSGAREAAPSGTPPAFIPGDHPTPGQEQQGQGAGGLPSAPPSPTAHSAAEWVEEVVREMTAARSVEDARARAARVLEAFERGVILHAAKQDGASPTTRLRAQLQEAGRENALLKRAVAIQNARLQDGGAREAEAAALRAELDAARRRIQVLQVQNYSLQVHLQAAAGSPPDAAGGAFRNPDVF
ncbi:hypothetical protein ACKKBF_B34445 [Auxenochlorella protothecoides x Auxenochlorella symbiontica]